MQIANLATTALTMTSREIADLVGKQHSNIKISADRLSEKGVIGTLAVQEFTHNGNKYTEYLLNKRDSLILVAQNCPEFTARIVDRWQELESKSSFQIPTTLSAALRLAADQADTIEAQQAKQAIKLAGNVLLLAQAIGVTPSAVRQWGKHPPIKRQYQIRAIYGVTA